MLGLFWTMCSAQSVCGFLFVLGFFCVPFFSPDCAEVDIVSRPLPLYCSFCGSLWECREEYTHPLCFLESPAGVASSENIVYWRLCQNKNPQRGRRGAEELCLCVYTALYSVHLHFFYFSLRLGVDLTLFYFLELPFLFNMKCTFILFRIIKHSPLNCSELQLGLVLQSVIKHKCHLWAFN